MKIFLRRGLGLQADEKVSVLNNYHKSVRDSELIKIRLNVQKSSSKNDFEKS